MRCPLFRAALLAGLIGLAGLAQAFDLQGHRGARGLEPENTLAAFERALGLGVTTLELDIALTADGVPVIAHDPHLPPDMARDAQGQWLNTPTPLIRSLTLAEVQRYDVGRAREGSATARNFPQQAARDGQRIPTLAALFARVQALGADSVRFNIETKLNPTKPDDTAAPEDFVRAILAVVRAAGVEKRVTLQSFEWRPLLLLQQQAPEIATAYLSVKSRNADNAADPQWTTGLKLADHPSVAHMVRAAGGAVWSPNFPSIDAAAVKQARQLGLKVIPWTVNDPADMQRLIDWGVDGLITDYPDRARAVLRTQSLPLPPAVAVPAH